LGLIVHFTLLGDVGARRVVTRFRCGLLPAVVGTGSHLKLELLLLLDLLKLARCPTALQFLGEFSDNVIDL
jgi:hypothetical protein